MTKLELVKEEIFKRTDLVLTEGKELQMLSLMKKEAEYFLANKFERPLKLGIPIDINARLKRAYGYFQFGSRALKISMSEELVVAAIALGDFEPVIDTLRHELVHYALFEMGKNFRDGENDFEETLARLRVSTSAATAQSKVKSSMMTNVLYMYDEFQCPTCKGVHYTKYLKNQKKTLGLCSKCHRIQDASKCRLKNTGNVKITAYAEV